VQDQDNTVTRPARQFASVSDMARFDRLPTSFGVFKPVGWLMVGVPTRVDADALATALAAAGWPAGALQLFTPSQVLPGLEAMLDNEGLLADFGFEIVLVRRYVELAKLGHHWLLVKVDGSAQAATAADLARLSHAALAIHYRLLTVEELI
jgi:hypothetical protein